MYVYTNTYMHTNAQTNTATAFIRNISKISKQQQRRWQVRWARGKIVENREFFAVAATFFQTNLPTHTCLPVLPYICTNVLIGLSKKRQQMLTTFISYIIAKLYVSPGMLVLLNAHTWTYPHTALYECDGVPCKLMKNAHFLIFLLLFFFVAQLTHPVYLSAY